MQFWNDISLIRDNPMLIEDSGSELTYGQFEELYQTVEDRLQERTLCFLFCKNTIGSVFFYLSFLQKDMVPLLLDNELAPDLRTDLTDLYRPDYLAIPDDDLTDLDETHWDVTAEMLGYVLLKRKESANVPLYKDLALLLTTSGSTGSPKLVRISRKNLLSNAAAIADYLHLIPSERPVTTLPMHYTYGLSVINSHMLAGAAVLLTQRTLFDTGFWYFAGKQGATSISGVPYTYSMLKRLDFFDMDLPSLRTMTQAGGKLPVPLHREFAEFAQKTGRNFIVMYGQTEATARMGYLPPQDALRKCGSMGIAIPGGKFTLMEDESTPVTEADTVGELVYSGPNVTLGYASGPEDLMKGDERGGILFTGDMAKRDEEGYYTITGRKKRFLKLFGKRVNMDEIEQLFRQKYEGLDVACVGEDDHMRIYVADRDAEFCRNAALWLNGETGLHPLGIDILPINEIPKTSSGKINYPALNAGAAFPG